MPGVLSSSKYSGRRQQPKSLHLQANIKDDVQENGTWTEAHAYFVQASSSSLRVLDAENFWGATGVCVPRRAKDLAWIALPP